MNESKLRKGTKYVSLKDEDIHTITGALKQFFRELKTDLIPTEIVKKLTNDFGKFDVIISVAEHLICKLVSLFQFQEKQISLLEFEPN